MKKQFEPIFQRLENAVDSFISEIQEQFKFSQEDALKILKVYRKEKVVKIDPSMGRYKLSHGIFWEAEPMKNAIAMYDENPKRFD